jgi:A/G-specific adenine glycosylase
MKERKQGDIWQGLYDFGLIEKEANHNIPILEHLWQKVENHQLLHFSNEQRLQTDFGMIRLLSFSKPYSHILTHQHLNVQFIDIQLEDDFEIEELLVETNLQLVEKEKVVDLPKPILITNFLENKMLRK